MIRLIQVLLVEDHLILQRCTKSLLENRGCEVTVVGTKEDALNEVQSRIFDLLLQISCKYGKLLFRTSEFHHLPRVGPKQLCASAHLGCTRAAGTS